MVGGESAGQTNNTQHENGDDLRGRYSSCCVLGCPQSLKYGRISVNKSFFCYDKDGLSIVCLTSITM